MVFAALTQMGIAEELIVPTLLILLGSVALAAALAFGLGGQNVAQRLVEQGYQKSGKARQQIQQQDGSFTRVDSGSRPDAWTARTRQTESFHGRGPIARPLPLWFVHGVGPYER